MLKGREIALTLRSSWIMNVVSINVCIINHISTNWTGVEPVGLSDMETGLEHRLCFQSRRVCGLQFPSVRWGGSQVERAVAFSPFPRFMRAGSWLFRSEWANICSISHGKAKKNEEEMPAGSAVVFTSLFHCVSREAVIWFAQTIRLTHVVKGTGDLIIAFNSARLFVFSSTRSQDCRNAGAKEAFKTLFSAESLTFTTWLIPKWAARFGVNWWVMKWNDAENVAGYLSHVYPPVTTDCV